MAENDGFWWRKVESVSITPYSEYRHGYYEEVQTFIPFTDEAKTEILATKICLYSAMLVRDIWCNTRVTYILKNLVIRRMGRLIIQEVSPNY